MFAIIALTFRDLVRSRIFTAAIVISALLIISGLFLASISLWNRERLLVDFGIGVVELSTLAVALYIGSTAFQKDSDGRVWYLLFSKPLSRLSYFLGKYFGILAVVFGVWLIESSVLIALVLHESGTLPDLMIPALIGGFLSIALVLSIMFVFATFTSPLTCLVVAIGSYIASSSIAALVEMGRRLRNPVLILISESLATILPPIHALSLKNLVMTPAVLGDGFLPLGTIGFALWHAIIYFIVMVAFGGWLFTRKSLDNV